jgi:hypothetical protein
VSGTQGIPSSAFERAGANYRATELTRGPWDPAHQHAGPPIALVGGAIERAAAALGFTHVARLTANLLRPIPIGELALDVRTEYAGKSVGHFAATLVAEGKELARFTAVAQREQALTLPDDVPGHPLPQAPKGVDGSVETRMPILADMVGYPELVQMRVATGRPFRTPSAVWFRLRHPLVAGETPLPIERVAVAADSGNGISAVLDIRRFLFLNSDLTINLLRVPRGEWICIDAQTLLGSSGGGLAESRIFDAEGLVGRATQSLAVRERG